jgi:hypothetical protein
MNASTNFIKQVLLNKHSQRFSLHFSAACALAASRHVTSFLNEKLIGPRKWPVTVVYLIIEDRTWARPRQASTVLSTGAAFHLHPVASPAVIQRPARRRRRQGARCPLSATSVSGPAYRRRTRRDGRKARRNRRC